MFDGPRQVRLSTRGTLLLDATASALGAAHGRLIGFGGTLQHRRMVVAVFLAMAISMAPMAAKGSDLRYFQFATTQSYLAASEDVRTGYVAGLLDVFLAFDMMSQSTKDCVSVMRLREIRAGFDRWLQNHPVEWRYSLPTNFSSAMHGLCE